MILREITKSELIKQTIERQIAEGNLNVGDRLPSRRALADRHNVSQAPVRQAIRELTRQGVIGEQKGRRGLFVKEAPSMPLRRSGGDKSSVIAVAYATLSDMATLDYAPLMSQLFLEALTEQVMHGGQTLQRIPYPLPSPDGDDRALRETLSGHSRVIFMGLDYIHWAEYLQSVHTMPIYLSGLWMPHRVNAILYDVAGTQKRVIEHLIELGHRKIAFAGRIGTRDEDHHKFLCYYRTLLAHGIRPDPDWAVAAVNSQMDGYLAARRLLQGLPPDRRPTAIAADTDYKAIGVITAIREAGLRVPGDISVVGLDNRPVARACDPQLTTAGPRWSDVGRTILEAIESMGTRPGPSPVRVHLPTELVVRASSAPPPTPEPLIPHRLPAPAES